MLGQLSLLFLALANPAASLSAPSVPVLWRVQFTATNGRGYFSQPSAAYVEILAACGHRPDFRQKTDYLPVSVLRCRGVLDFSSSSTIRERIEKRIHLAEQRGHKAAINVSLAKLRAELAKLDFSISPFGVFFSAQPGEGYDRRVGINVAETRLVILNKPFWAQLVNSPDADAFLLHEALGALGYEDTDYDRSNLIYELSKKDHVPGDEDGRIRVAAQERGGATVVGRGGDSNAQFFKASLLLLTDKKLDLLGGDTRFAPTPAELRRVIEATPVSIAPARFFEGQNLCKDPYTGRESPLTCGAFNLKGIGGKPFLLITQDWAQFSDTDRHKLLLKIFNEIVNALYHKKKNGR